MDAPKISRLTGAALLALALALAALSACGSSGGSESGSDATTTTTAAAAADDAAYVTAVDAACATHTKEVKAANEATAKAGVAEIDAVTLQQQSEAVTQLTALSDAVAAAGGTSADAKALAATLADLPDAYSTLNTVSAPLYGTDELSSEDAAALQKKLEAPTAVVEKDLGEVEKLAKKLGLDDCVAMVEAIGPT